MSDLEDSGEYSASFEADTEEKEPKVKPKEEKVEDETRNAAPAPSAKVSGKKASVTSNPSSKAPEESKEDIEKAAKEEVAAISRAKTDLRPKDAALALAALTLGPKSASESVGAESFAFRVPALRGLRSNLARSVVCGESGPLEEVCGSVRSVEDAADLLLGVQGNGGVTLLHLCAAGGLHAGTGALLRMAAHVVDYWRDVAREELRREAVDGGRSLPDAFPDVRSNADFEARGMPAPAREAGYSGAGARSLVDPPSGHRMWALRALDRLERLRLLRREALVSAALMARDDKGRTALHAGAACGSGACERVLDTMTRCRGDLEAVGPSGFPLFPCETWVCMRTGAVFSGLEVGTDVLELPEDPSPLDPAVAKRVLGEIDAAAAEGVAVAPSQWLRDELQRCADGQEHSLPHWAVDETAPEGLRLRVCVDDLVRRRREILDAPDAHGATAMHYASARGNARDAGALIRAGANRDAQTIGGDTPLSLAPDRVIRRVLFPLADAIVRACAAPASTLQETKQEDDEEEDESKFAAIRKTKLAAPEAPLHVLLASGANPNTKQGPQLRAPLHSAAHAGREDLVLLLLAAGADVDIRDATGWTPLALACEAGTGTTSSSAAHVRVVRALLQAGADPDAPSVARRSPLHHAVTMSGRWGNRAPQLSESSPTEKHQLSESSPTEKFSESSSTEKQQFSDPDSAPDALIGLLAGAGASIDARDQHSLSPLLLAARHGRHEAVAALLLRGADVHARDFRGATALHLAAQKGHAAVCRLLVRWDAETGLLKRVTDAAGRTAYDVAPQHVRSAMETLWEAAASGSLERTEKLVRESHRAPVESSDPSLPVRTWEGTRLLGRTALHCAVTGAALAVRDALSSDSKRGGRREHASANPKSGIGFELSDSAPVKFITETKDIAGPHTIYQLMPVGGHVERPQDIRRWRAKPAIVPAGALVNGTHGANEAAWHTERAYVNVCRALCAAGSDPDAPDKEGVTPLMLAARAGLSEIITLLLAAGADSDKRDLAGNSALHYASAYGHAAASVALSNAGADATAYNVEGKVPEDVAGKKLAILAVSRRALDTLGPDAAGQDGDGSDDHMYDPKGKRYYPLERRALTFPAPPPLSTKLAVPHHSAGLLTKE